MKEKAERIFYDKAVLVDGAVVEMVIWKLPAIDIERPHALKYRLFYGCQDERIVGYDNERGKGDHKHVRGVEKRYRFVSVEKLIADFLADVEKAQGESHE